MDSVIPPTLDFSPIESVDPKITEFIYLMKVWLKPTVCKSFYYTKDNKNRSLICLRGILIISENGVRNQCSIPGLGDIFFFKVITQVLS